MKAPSFWYGPTPNTSIRAALLTPLASLYDMAARMHRERRTPKRSPLPVICLGNLVAGGTGKTPTAIAMMDLLKSRNTFLSPGFLTRGYRGKIEKPERVDESHDPAMWGDEALLLNRHGPTYVARNRYKGTLLMKEQGCDAVLMDDGLQHYSLEKDLSFAIIDGMMGFGNGMVIPAGPLRQSLADGFALCDAFILIGEDQRNVKSLLPSGKPVFTASTKVKPDHKISREYPYVAFCGIGYPEKFRATLQKSEIDLCGWHAFPDHHPYTMAEIQQLVGEATLKQAHLITTEKDYARLPDFAGKELIKILPIEISFSDPDALADFIKTKTAAKLAGS